MASGERLRPVLSIVMGMLLLSLSGCGLFKRKDAVDPVVLSFAQSLDLVSMSTFGKGN